MAGETFKQWQPHESIPARVEITGIRDEDDGLCVGLASQQTRAPVATLVFQDFIAYRNINESFRLRTWNSQDMRGSSSLLIVDGSSWLRWLNEESGSVLEEFDVTHYAIYTNDDCLDVAAKAAPLVVRSLDARIRQVPSG